MNTDPIKTQWDTNYSNPEYIYGELPNEFLKAQLLELTPGRILFGAEGEGRNAVYAATLGWEVSAFDISEEGRRKAKLLEEKTGVSVDYRIGNLPELGFNKEGFDAAALIFAHFPPDVRSEFHKIIGEVLKPGGTLTFEGFSKEHLAYREKNPKVGGPGHPDFLFSKDELVRDFPDFDFKMLEETEIQLSEGLFHNGTGHVVRMVAVKTK